MHPPAGLTLEPSFVRAALIGIASAQITRALATPQVSAVGSKPGKLLTRLEPCCATKTMQCCALYLLARVAEDQARPTEVRHRSPRPQTLHLQATRIHTPANVSNATVSAEALLGRLPAQRCAWDKGVGWTTNQSTTFAP